MHAYTFHHLSKGVLLRDLAARVAKDCTATAELLGLIAEVDVRKLYLPAGYPSMHAYCVDALHLSEDAAYKRIQAARAARQFPALLTALAEGWLHLSAVCLLVPHLTPENADELMAAATHQRKSAIEQLLAQRFPRPEVPARVQPVGGATSLLNSQLAPVQVETHLSERGQLAPGQVEAPKVTPIAPERFSLQVTIDKATHDKLRYAQSLLSHAIPSGDVAQVLDRVLDTAIAQIEKRKFGATTKPRPRRPTSSKRHIPAHVKRAIWERDRGQCTFVGDTGHRCSATRFLEFDHVDSVARGGQATVEGVRLRCRGHNQHEAERTFGAGFMSERREEARRAAAEARAAAQACAAAEARAIAEARAAAEARARAAAKEQARDVMAGLRQLGVRAEVARRAAEFSETLIDATLEERMRAALKFLCPKPRFRGRVMANLGAST